MQKKQGASLFCVSDVVLSSPSECSVSALAVSVSVSACASRAQTSTNAAAMQSFRTRTKSGHTVTVAVGSCLLLSLQAGQPDGLGVVYKVRFHANSRSLYYVFFQLHFALFIQAPEFVYSCSVSGSGSAASSFDSFRAFGIEAPLSCLWC